MTTACTIPAVPGTDESATPHYLEIRNLGQLTRPGTTFPLAFTFERAGEVALDAKVQVTRDGPAATFSVPAHEHRARATNPVPGAEESQEITVPGPVERSGDGCLLLAAAEGRPYVLLGGAHVVVRGRLEPGVVTCAHGAALRVLDALPK